MEHNNWNKHLPESSSVNSHSLTAAIVIVYVQMCRRPLISFLSQRIKSWSVKMAYVFKV